MFNLGFSEIALILVIALVFVGPKMLPEMASSLGKMIREFRKATSDIRNELELDDVIRKPLQELREAATLPPEELKRRDELRASQQKADEEDRLRKLREAAAEKALAEGTATGQASEGASPPESADPYSTAAATVVTTSPADRTVYDPDLATAVKAEMKRSPALPSPHAAERTIVDDSLLLAAKAEEKTRTTVSKAPRSTIAMEKVKGTPTPVAEPRVVPAEVITTGGTMISTPPPPVIEPERTPMLEASAILPMDPTPPPAPKPVRLPPPPPVKKS